MSFKPMNEYKFDFVKSRKIYFIISSTIAVVGLVCILLFGLNYGVDFKSGTNLDISVSKGNVTNDQVNAILEEAGYGDLTPSIGEERVSIRFEDAMNEDELNTIIDGFEKVYGEGNISHEENTVDAGVAKELGKKAIIVVLLASLGIIIYVTIRFEWRFALSAVIALIHDAFVVIAIFSIFRLEVSLTFIAAVLTIIGYSINDTIVIFDRIRENLKKMKVKTTEDLSKVVNTSIWQTLSRSVNTALTVVIAALALLIFGSESIRLFSLAILIGLISGGYSSIFVASQLWFDMKKGTLKKKTVTSE
ncbi:protein translocase subunit SecF [Marinicrinis lubricantis]|uniref:Protein-export membrane protein SecF n=1 Tax=Marinicrinis lubricantis TaxID=2086470 RepID=A0ABW1ITN5_9BACL